MSEKIEGQPKSTEIEAPKVEAVEPTSELTDEQAAAVVGGAFTGKAPTTVTPGKPTTVRLN